MKEKLKDFFNPRLDATGAYQEFYKLWKNTEKANLALKNLTFFLKDQFQPYNLQKDIMQPIKAFG